MAARVRPDNCMFCDMGECPTHTPKTKTARKVLPRKIVTVQLPAGAEVETPSRAVLARRAQFKTDEGDLDAFNRAVRALVPILADEELIKWRDTIGPELVDRQLRVNKWRRDIREGK